MTEDDDELVRAFRALRKGAEGSGPTALSRARIISRLKEQRRRRGRALVVLPLAAALFASAAWAALSGHFPGLFSGAPERGHAVPVVNKGEAPVLPIFSAETGSIEPSAQSPVIPLPPTASGANDFSRSRAPVVAAPPPISAPRPAAALAWQREQALYEAAHRAHFVEHQPATALLAWEKYLAEFANGRFAMEARYNRAISLVRLGRVTEARAALEPFANGSQGGYRREEARELLEALITAAPATRE